MASFIQRFARIAIVILAVFGSSNSYPKDGSMNNSASVCFGRFLIDLPEGSHIAEIGHQSEFFFGKISTQEDEINESQFSTLMDKREASFKGINPEKARALVDSRSLSKSIRVFVTLQNIFGYKDYGLEFYKLDKGRLFSSVESNYDLNSFKDKVLTPLEEKFLPNLHARNIGDIPSDAGLCIKDGFVAGDGSDRTHEKIEIQMNFKEWPDLWVSLYSNTVHSAGQKTLLQRIDSNPLPAALARTIGQLRVLRKGKHSVGSFSGEEVLYVLPTEDKFKVHDFTWEFQGALEDPFRPTLHLELSSGNADVNGNVRHVRPSLSDEQAIKIFDTIVNSIRLRPTAPQL